MEEINKRIGAIMILLNEKNSLVAPMIAELLGEIKALCEQMEVKNANI